MSRRDEPIARSAADARETCQHRPAMGLLRKMAIGCRPTIHDRGTAAAAASQPKEIKTIRRNFLIRKLGLKGGPGLMEWLQEAPGAYGKSEHDKIRAVVHYRCVRHFRRGSAYA